MKRIIQLTTNETSWILEKLSKLFMFHEGREVSRFISSKFAEIDEFSLVQDSLIN